MTATHRTGSIVAVLLTLACLGIAAITGWYSTAYAGFTLFIFGWLLYALVGALAMVLALLAAQGRGGVARAIVIILLLAVGGPAACTGSVLLLGECQRRHTSPSGTVDSSACR